MEYFCYNGHMTKSKKIKAFFTIFILAAAIGLVVYFFPYITPKWQTLTIELGDVPPSEIRDYLDGADWVLERTSFDTSQIDSDNVGVYEVTSSFLWVDLVQEVEIVDTTAPTLKINVPNVLETYTTYTLQDFVVEVVDNSNDVDVYFELNGENNGDALFNSEAGTYNGSIVAIDTNGNETKIDFSTTFDDPPYYIVLPPSQYACVNDEEYDPLNLIVAYDDTDDCRIVDLDIQGEYDISTIGTYNVSCVATDSYGFKSVQNFTIDVVDNKTTAISKQNEYILSKEQLETLVNIDYFKYAPLKEEDKEAVVELVKPTLVTILWEVDRTISRYPHRANGSAFIYDIGVDEIKILSVKHVTNGKLRNGVPDLDGLTDIMFFDNTSIYLPVNLEYEESNVSRNESTLFTCNTVDIPFTTLMALKQVWYSEDIYDEFNGGENVISICKWLDGENGFRIRYGTLYGRDKWEYMANSARDEGLSMDVIATSRLAVKGVSGSALMDLHGRLLGLASWVSYVQDIDAWCKVDNFAKQWGDNGSIKE